MQKLPSVRGHTDSTHPKSLDKLNYETVHDVLEIKTYIYKVLLDKSLLSITLLI